MAIDSAQKRKSMLSFGDALIGERVPEATNMDSAADRTAQLFMYFGIPASSGGGGTPSTQVSTKKAWWNFFRRRR